MPSGTFTRVLPPSIGRHLELAAERRRGHRDRHAAEEVGAVALEELVRLDRQEDVEVAGRAAAQARLAFAGEADAGAVLDAGRDVDRERALLGDAAGAAAVGQGSAITSPRPWQVGQVRSMEKKPWARAPGRGRRRSGRSWAGAGLGAGAGAGLAGDLVGTLDLGGLAGEGLLERDLQVVAKVGAALAAAARLPPPRPPPPMKSPNMSSKMSDIEAAKSPAKPPAPPPPFSKAAWPKRS